METDPQKNPNNSTHEQNTIETFKNEHSVESQMVDKEQKKYFWTLKKKICVFIAVLLVFLGIGLGVSLYFKFRTTLEQTGTVTRAAMAGDSIYSVGQFQLKEKHFFSDDMTVKLLLTQSVTAGTTASRRMLQDGTGIPEATVDYSSHVNLEDVGFQLTFTPDDKLLVRVEVDALSEYLISQNPQTERLLTQAMQTESIDENATISEVQQELSKAFGEYLGAAGSFQFKQTPMVDFVFNKQVGGFQFATESNGTRSTPTRMLMVRMLFFKKIINKVRQVVNNIVRPIVNVVRKSGPLIGSVAGALVGGLVGGPAGAVAGFHLGGKIGFVASTAIQACDPRNTVRIKCTADSVKQAAKNAGISLAMGAICDKTVCGKIVNGTVGAVARMTFGK